MLSERVLCIKASKNKWTNRSAFGRRFGWYRVMPGSFSGEAAKKNCTSCLSEERRFNDGIGFFFALVVYSRIAASEKNQVHSKFPDAWELSCANSSRFSMFSFM